MAGCMGHRGKNRLRYGLESYSFVNKIFNQMDSSKPYRNDYEATWEIKDDSLFLVKWKPGDRFHKPQRKAPHFVEWFSGTLIASDTKRKELSSTKSIRFDIINGVVTYKEVQECDLTSTHLYDAARIAFAERRYELAHDLFAKLYFEDHGFFKRDWVLLFIITCRNILGGETSKLCAEHHEKYSQSPSNYFVIAKELLHSISDSSVRDSLIDKIRDEDIQDLMNWSVQGFIEQKDLIQYHISPESFQIYPKAVKIHETIQKQGRVEITPLDIPYLILITGMNKNHLEYLVPLLYSIDIDEKSRERIRSVESREIWFVSCELKDSPAFKYEDVQIEIVMENVYRY